MSNVMNDINMFFQATNLGLNTVETLTKVMYETLAFMDKDPAARALNLHMKEYGPQSLEFSFCKPEHLQELSKRFDQEGIVHVKANHMSLGGVGMLVYKDADRERAGEVLGKFRAEFEPGGITDKSFIYYKSNGNVREIHGLSLPEMMLFEEHAKEQGINIACEGPDSDQTYVVFYDGDDRGKINGIKTEIAVEMSGRAGQVLRAQLEYESEKFSRISEEMMQQPESTYHIADLDGKSITVTKYGISYDDGEHMTSIDRDDKRFAIQASAFLSNMRQPQILTKEEFEEFNKADLEEKLKIMKEKEIQDQHRPKHSHADLEAVRKMMDEKILYESKLAQENPEQEIYSYSYTNNEMRWGTFKEFENINKEAVHDKEAAFIPDADIYDDARSRYRGYKDEPSIMDMEQQELRDNLIQDEVMEYNEPGIDYMDDRNLADDIYYDAMSESEIGGD